jgi:aminoglycoside 3-N-acetyltransferase
MSYTYDEIKRAYRNIGVAAGGVVYLVGELWRLREYAEPGAEAVCAAHYRALRELVGEEGTIAVSTATPNLVNTDTVFDPETTPSSGTGIFSEYVRLLPGARRSLHPFVSYAAIGPAASAITENCSPHAFGPESPEARLCDMNALFLAVGMAPNFACSTAHHVEHVCGIPFRYIKEFVHPVLRDGRVVREQFYLHVWYRDTGMVKDRYRKLFERLEGNLETRVATLGRGKVFGYDMAEFFRKACAIVAREPYISCEYLPETRPYRS